MRKAFGWVRILLALMVAVSLACNAFVEREKEKSEALPEPVEPAIEERLALGELIERPTATIGPAGGTISVAEPGDPLNGFLLQVPDGAFSKEIKLKVSYRSISSSPGFNPLSPLITLDTGGEVAKVNMKLVLPVEVPEGQRPMAFYVDEVSGQREGLPTLGLEQNALVTAAKRPGSIAVAGVDRAKLETPAESGFKPGVDNWQFTNEGSYLAPYGFCAGQTLTAMYYYTEKKVGEGAPPLFGHYDNYDNPYHNTPELMWDDDLAFRLASMAQLLSTMIEIKPPTHEEIQELIFGPDLPEPSDKTVFEDFVSAISETGSPQYVGIYHEGDKGVHEGHAMIVYRATGTRLWILDPNHKAGPGQAERTLELNPATGELVPYLIGNQPFDVIEYVGGRHSFDLPLLAELWSQFEAGTVGAIPNMYGKRFPSYTIQVQERDVGDPENPAAPGPLVNNYQTYEETIWVSLKAEGFSPRLTWTDHQQADDQTFREGTWRGQVEGEKELTIKLKPGVNTLGFLVEGRAPSGRYEWVGFKWFNIYRDTSATEEPPEQEGPSVEECDAREYLLISYGQEPESHASFIGCQEYVRVENTHPTDLIVAFALDFEYNREAENDWPEGKWFTHQLKPGESAWLGQRSWVKDGVTQRYTDHTLIGAHFRLPMPSGGTLGCEYVHRDPIAIGYEPILLENGCRVEHVKQ